MKAVIWRVVAAASVVLLSLLGTAGCTRAELPASERNFVIAGGSTTGVYYNYGLHLADVLGRDLDLRADVVETGGSVDNLRRIDAGEALFGFAQGDTAADAMLGAGSFERPLSIKAMARLYDEYVHVVVRADSDIEQLSDFSGRTVSLGAPGSGVNVVAVRILDAVEVPTESINNPELGLGASIAALAAEEIDGFFWVGGLPTPGIEQLANSTAIKLLSVDPATVDQINATHAGVYRTTDLPVGAYGRNETTSTMMVPNYLLVSETASDRLVQEVLETLFASRTEIAKDVPAAALLDRRQAIFTDPVPLHPGASAYYSSTKR